MSNNIGDVRRLGNPRIDPVTGQPLTAPPGAFTTGGVATDPSTVTLTVTRPDKTSLVYGWPVALADGPLTRESVGRFYADVLVTQSGTWWYEMAGTGAVSEVEQGSFHVERRRVTP